MANKKEPPIPKQLASSEGAHASFGQIDQSHLSNLNRAFLQGLRGEAVGDEISTSVSTSIPTSVSTAVEGGVAGGSQEKKRGSSGRNKQGRTALQGGDRTVRFYKPTEAELERLGELNRDEGFAWAKFAFCVGLLADVILGMLFATGLSAGSKGAGEAIGLCAFLAGLNFLLEAIRKRRVGKSALDKLKGDHDFTVSI